MGSTLPVLTLWKWNHQEKKGNQSKGSWGTGQTGGGVSELVEKK